MLKRTACLTGIAALTILSCSSGSVLPDAGQLPIPEKARLTPQPQAPDAPSEAQVMRDSRVEAEASWGNGEVVAMTGTTPKFLNLKVDSIKVDAFEKDQADANASLFMKCGLGGYDGEKIVIFLRYRRGDGFWKLEHSTSRLIPPTSAGLSRDKRSEHQREKDFEKECGKVN